MYTEQEHQKALSKKDKIIADKDTRIALLEELVALQKSSRFGASSEKSSDQQEMFNEAELTEQVDAIQAKQTLEPEPTETEQASGEPTVKASSKRGRKPLPKELPRIRIEHDLSEAEKLCPCGCQRTLIGEEISEQLDIIPAKIRVLQHVRKKYACKACEDGVQTAELPLQPIPKSNASAGLLAHVAISKYQDALPLYRQEAILSRSGVDIPRNTLANWMIKAGALLEPLLTLCEQTLLAYPVMHCDETTVQVLKEKDRKAQNKSYMWVRVGGPPAQPVRLFHYAAGRGGSVACELLNGYTGYLQTDDYAGYNAVCAKNEITQLGCWAHARRKFIEAQKATHIKGKAKKVGKADVVISLISKLYAIEKKIKDLNADGKYNIRQQESVPQLEKIRIWLDKTLHQALPKGTLGKALGYLNKNWDKLTVYSKDGRLNIDNNPAENAIRPFVIGRKNWLFSATVSGAESSANFYSLIETAKANGLEPYSYLRHVFTLLPQAQTQESVAALLPWHVSTEVLQEVG